jgi:hypothetical protein
MSLKIRNVREKSPQIRDSGVADLEIRPIQVIRLMQRDRRDTTTAPPASRVFEGGDRRAWRLDADAFGIGFAVAFYKDLTRTPRERQASL